MGRQNRPNGLPNLRWYGYLTLRAIMLAMRGLGMRKLRRRLYPHMTRLLIGTRSPFDTYPEGKPQ